MISVSVSTQDEKTDKPVAVGMSGILVVVEYRIPLKDDLNLPKMSLIFLMLTYLRVS